jgi:hypothetical protein
LKKDKFFERREILMFTIAVEKKEFEELLLNTTDKLNSKQEIKCKKLAGN